jgi:hypothetical protein
MGHRGMKSKRWSWIGASSTGTSHLASGLGCDDAGACVETFSENGSTLICVVSDGAGSAALSRIGSHIVVRCFCRSALKFARSGGRPKDLDREVALNWLDDIRDRIERAASREGSQSRRPFAATLLGCVVQTDGLALLHVGDGACALRLRSEQEWRIPSWPAQGEFASTTNFVTDDPEPVANIEYIGGEVAEVVLFTDGLERLALNFVEKKPFTPFFTSMFQAMSLQSPGRNRRLSQDLRAFLNGAAVTERTDDDKTLIMARQY